MKRLALSVVIAVALGGCGKADLPSIPPSVDAWARRVLAMPTGLVCQPGERVSFCVVRETLVDRDVRALGMHTIWLQGLGDERYIDMDWGGGHTDAYGVIIGPVGWNHVADTERRETRIRDGVFRYDSQP